MSEEALDEGSLTRERLFELVTDEVYRDGVVEEDEHRLLQALVRFLRLSSDTARSIARKSKERFVHGELGSQRSLSPIELYRSVLIAICADGQIDDLEVQMSLGLRQILGIDEDTHRAALAEATRRGEQKEPPSGPYPIDQVEQLLSEKRPRELGNEIADAVEMLLSGEAGPCAPAVAISLVNRCLDHIRVGGGQDSLLIRSRLTRLRAPLQFEVGEGDRALAFLAGMFEDLAGYGPTGPGLSDMTEMLDDLVALKEMGETSVEDRDPVMVAEFTTRIRDRAADGVIQRQARRLVAEERALLLAAQAEIQGKSGDISAVRRLLRQAESLVAPDRSSVSPSVFERLADIEVLYG